LKENPRFERGGVAESRRRAQNGEDHFLEISQQQMWFLEHFLTFRDCGYASQTS
jgi:hypothetical protein